MSGIVSGPLFLSRLTLDMRSRRTRAEIAYPYEMHRTLMQAFPTLPAGEKAKVREKFNVLFRTDIDELRNRAGIIVQSTAEPDWTALETIPGYLSRPPESKIISARYNALRNERILSFRLRANPTKRIGKSGQDDGVLCGKRVGLLRAEEQIAWLIRKEKEREKGKPGGFEILMKEVEAHDGTRIHVARVNAMCEGKRIARKNGAQTTHLSVLFEGVLRITDEDAFRETLISGIGSGKAFGFGLLSIARL